VLQRASGHPGRLEERRHERGRTPAARFDSFAAPHFSLRSKSSCAAEGDGNRQLARAFQQTFVIDLGDHREFPCWYDARAVRSGTTERLQERTDGFWVQTAGWSKSTAQVTPRSRPKIYRFTPDHGDQPDPDLS
jgi:hypothetical protein